MPLILADFFFNNLTFLMSSCKPGLKTYSDSVCVSMGASNGCFARFKTIKLNVSWCVRTECRLMHLLFNVWVTGQGGGIRGTQIKHHLGDVSICQESTELVGVQAPLFPSLFEYNQSKLLHTELLLHIIKLYFSYSRPQSHFCPRK